MSLPARQWHSFAEYVALEELSPIKHEFLDGHVWAMAGGSPEHAAVTMNVGALLLAQLRGRPCRVFSSDLRVRCEATGLSTYPDVTVVCGNLELDPSDPTRHTVTNPRVLVEVLSPSTEHYDRGEKLEHYRQIDSVQEVVLVALDEQAVDVWRRDQGEWRVARTEPGGTAKLASIGCDLPLPEVYRDPLLPSPP
jgi:Uma2 family endonuclease